MAESSDADAARLVGKDQGRVVLDSRLVGFGVINKLLGASTGGRLTVIEHPLQPLALGAPRHTHHHEDEISFILEGEVMIEVGGQVFRARPGDLVYKPRDVSHAFWNPGEEPALVLEIIAPANLESYFEELAALFAEPGPPDPARLASIAPKYDIKIEPQSVPELAERYHLRLGPPPPGKD